MKIKKILLSAAAALASLTSLCACGENSGLRLGTGNPGGIYYAYGSMLSELDGTVINVKKTEGSRANMRLMNEGFLDLAIVQSDVLAEAAGGTGDFEGSPVNGVRAVAGLYYEAFQVIVRADSDIYAVSDLRDRTISVGEEGSGVSGNAEYLLTSAGIPANSVSMVNMSYAESALALEDGSIDAFFVILGTPSTVVTELSESTDIRFLPLNEHTISAMTNIYGGYYSMTIPAGTYHGQDEDIPTVGVKAVLTADSRISSSQIHDITELLFNKSGSIKYTVTVAEPELDFAVSGIPCAFHDGAAKYYESVGVTVETDPTAGVSRITFGTTGD